MKSQLVVTFTTKQDYNKLIDHILDNYTLTSNKIFVLSTTTPYELICSYTLSMTPNTVLIDNSIPVHRKTETNTMFTVNALNLIIKKETGRIDKTHNINWNNYKNSLIISEKGELKLIPTKLFVINQIR